MTTTIGSLNWKPYQAAQGGSLIASVTLSGDTAFLVPTSAPYSNQNPLYADGVIIDNTQNNGVVTITAGPLVTTISQFSRDYIALDKNIGGNVLILFTVGTVNLLFYNGTPPINPSLTNYGGALANLAAIGFTGGSDTGSPNARSITVSDNYAFTNGTLLSYTSSRDNTGPATLRVNGAPPIAITRCVPDANGLQQSVALVGGELGHNCAIVVSCNAVTGTFDIVSHFNIFQSATSYPPGTATCAVAGTFQRGISLILPLGSANEIWRIDAKLGYLNTSGGNMQVTGQLADFTAGTIVFDNATGVMIAGANTTLNMSADITITPAIIAQGVALWFTDNVGGNVGRMNVNSLSGAAGFATWIRTTRLQ